MTTTQSPQSTRAGAMPRGETSPAALTPLGHTGSDAHVANAEGFPFSRAANAAATSRVAAPHGPTFPLGHECVDAQVDDAEGALSSRATRAAPNPHRGGVAREPHSPLGYSRFDIQLVSAEGSNSPRMATGDSASIQAALSGESSNLADHAQTDNQVDGVGQVPNVPDSHAPGVNHRSTAVRDSNSTVSHIAYAAHMEVADGGPFSAGDQSGAVAQNTCVASGVRPRQAQRAWTSVRLWPAGPTPPGTTDRTIPMEKSSLADPTLALAADVLDDLETVRIANENRLRQLTRSVEDSDGEMRGFGFMPEGICEPDNKKLVEKLVKSAADQVAEARANGKRLRCPDSWHPSVWRLTLILGTLCAAEDDAIKNLEQTMKTHPLGPWVKAQKGVGEKQGARLLAAIGDPYIRPEWADDDGVIHPAAPRTVSQLWAYCGYKPGQRRVAREKVDWSPTAKKRAYVVAESCLKQLVKPCHSLKDEKGRYVGAKHGEDCACSPYRVLYDQARAKYAGSLHHETCVRCGPAGRPAETGSARSDQHVHQMAIRVVSKRLLRDLWREAKRIHEQ